MGEKTSNNVTSNLPHMISVTQKVEVHFILFFSRTISQFLFELLLGREALCQIPLSNILAVERLAEPSFKMKNMFQIVQPERALYVQAANCVEEKEWVDLLTKICQTNANRLEKYHPCAFINSQWLW